MCKIHSRYVEKIRMGHVLLAADAAFVMRWAGMDG
jgi:hypothetical protein